MVRRIGGFALAAAARADVVFTGRTSERGRDGRAVYGVRLSCRRGELECAAPRRRRAWRLSAARSHDAWRRTAVIDAGGRRRQRAAVSSASERARARRRRPASGVRRRRARRCGVDYLVRIPLA